MFDDQIEADATFADANRASFVHPERRTIAVALKGTGCNVAVGYGRDDATAHEFAAETGIPVFKFDVADFAACARGVKAIEAFGSTGDGARGCLLPADYLRSVGFKTVRPHPIYPRLRMELKSTVSWRYDVEYALEKIFGTGPARSLTPVS